MAIDWNKAAQITQSAKQYNGTKIQTPSVGGGTGINWEAAAKATGQTWKPTGTMSLNELFAPTSATGGSTTGRIIATPPAGATARMASATKKTEEEEKKGGDGWWVLKRHGLGIAGGVAGVVDAGAAAVADEINRDHSIGTLVNRATGAEKAALDAANKEQLRTRLKKEWDERGEDGAAKTAKDILFTLYDASVRGLKNDITSNPAISLGAGVLTKAATGIASRVSGKDEETVKKEATDTLYSLTDPVYEARDRVAMDREGRSNAVQIAGDVAEGVGQMVPGIALSLATGSPDAGLLAMSGSAGGSAAKEAYQNGASADQAATIGLEKGIVELGTEKMFSGFALMGDGIVSTMAKTGLGKAAAQSTFAAGLKDTLGKFAASRAGHLLLQGGELLGENVEEAVSDWVDSNLDSVVYGNGEGSTLKESFAGQMPWTRQGLITMLTSIILSGTNYLAKNNVTKADTDAAVDNAMRAQEDAQASETAAASQPPTGAQYGMGEVTPAAPQNAAESVKRTSDAAADSPTALAERIAAIDKEMARLRQRIGKYARDMEAWREANASAPTIYGSDGTPHVATPGTWVIALDRGNRGRVVSAQGDTVTVSFRSRDGLAATRPFRSNELEWSSGGATAPNNTELRSAWAELDKLNEERESLLASYQQQEQQIINDPTAKAQFEEQNNPTDSGTPPTEGRTAPTQSAFGEQLHENDPIEQSTHEVRSDAQVEAEAQERLERDPEGEKSRLFSTDRQTWGDTDTREAQRILTEATEKARQSGAAEDWAEVARLRQVYDAEGTRAGQEMRQRRTFKNTPEDIVSAAADILYGKNKAGLDNARSMTDAEKAEVMKNVEQFAKDAANIAEGDTAAVIEQIKKLNEARRTTGLFSKETGRMVNEMLEWVSKQDGGEAYLRNLLNAQVQGYADDFKAPSRINQAKTFRVMNLLSNFGTVMRNFSANGVFDPMETLSNNIALPFDMLLSKISGKRGVAYNRAVFSGAKWQGKGSGFIKSALQVMLDAEFDVTTGKYETGSRLFKMGGGAKFFERLLSTYQMVENLALKSTDEYTKSGVRAEALRGYERFVEQGILSQKEAEEMADNIAKERTLQEDSVFSQKFKQLRDVANFAGIHDKRGGSLGAGDLLLTFAQVPANAGLMNIRMNPFAGGAIALKNMVSAIESAKNGTLTADQQRKAALSAGRAINGLGLTVIGMVLSAKGIIKVVRGDDKDKTALEKSEGRNGLQINLSAFKRLLGGEDTGWQTGDDLMSIGFLEQLAGQLMLGDLLYHGYKEDGRLTAREVASANAESLFETMLALPAVSQLSDIRNSWQYSEAEDAIGKAGDVLTDFGGNVASSFLVPNGVRAIARGTDNTVRNTYSSGTTAGDVFDYFRSGVPVLRQQLPSSVDSWGQEQHYTNSDVQNFLNSVILPGAITQYNTNDVNQEIERLSEAGHNAYPNRSAYSREVNGEELNAEDLRAWNVDRGSTAYDLLSDLFSTGSYQTMMNEDKKKAINAIYEYSRALADDKAGSDKKADSWIDNAYQAQRSGGDAVGYIAMKGLYGSELANAYLNLTDSGVDSEAASAIIALVERRGGKSQDRVAAIIHELNLSDEAAETLWGAFGWKTTWEEYDK